MAKVAIFQLKTKVNKDGTHPIVVKLSNGKKRNYIFLDFSCKSAQWNNELSRFNSKYKNYKKYNRILSVYDERIEEILDYFKVRNLEFSKELFKRKFQKNLLKNSTVFEYFDQVVSELNASNKIGNARALNDAKSALKRYNKSTGLMFQDIDTIYLTKYKNWLQSQKNKQGEYISDRTISIYLRGLRAVYYRAINDELISEELNPFGKRKFSLNKGLNLNTRKRAISKNDMLKIYNYKGVYLEARHLFIFSYLCAGMNFIDMSYLKWNNLKNGRIEYRRLKTRKEHSIKITEPIQEILNYYKPYNSDYIFPIINKKKHKTEIQIRERIHTANGKLNKDLKELGKKLEINQTLTSYVARHSMATVLYRAGGSVAEIQETMGHSRENETRIYLDSINQDKKDKLLKDKLL